LFEALMAWTTRQGTDALDAIAADETLDPLTALHRFAAQLLALMLQPKKLALFRIAVAEGNRLSAVGRTYSAFTRDHGMERGRARSARFQTAWRARPPSPAGRPGSRRTRRFRGSPPAPSSIPGCPPAHP